MRLLLAMAGAIALAAQTTAPQMAGSWTAEFQGHTYVRLNLTTSNGAIGGAIALGSVEVDKTGIPIHVGEAPSELTPIFDVRLTDGALTFARKDGRDTDRFELTLDDGGHASLRFILTNGQLRHLASDGIPAPKPFPLTKH